MIDPIQVLQRLRAICLALPEAVEVVTWGHPTFRAGRRDFVVWEHYHGEWCIALRVGRSLQRELLKDARFYLTPYVGKHGWVSLRATGPLDWVEVAALAHQSYRQVAIKRMLRAFDGSRGPGAAVAKENRPGRAKRPSRR